MILTIRTDKPEAEIGLFKRDEEVAYKTWQAHRELSATLLKNLKEILDQNKINWADLKGIVIYKGPGSFTGLRIGFSVANTISDSENVPIVSTNTEDWLQDGIARLQKGEDEKIALPEYGGQANTTKPKK